MSLRAFAEEHTFHDIKEEKAGKQLLPISTYRPPHGPVSREPLLLVRLAKQSVSLGGFAVAKLLIRYYCPRPLCGLLLPCFLPRFVPALFFRFPFVFNNFLALFLKNYLLFFASRWIAFVSLSISLPGGRRPVTGSEGDSPGSTQGEWGLHFSNPPPTLSLAFGLGLIGGACHG